MLRGRWPRHDSSFAGALVVLLLVQVLQLPVIAVGSVENSGEVPFPPFGQSDPGRVGTEQANLLLHRPSTVGRERVSLGIALRRLGVNVVHVGADVGRNPGVLAALTGAQVSQVPLRASILDRHPTPDLCEKRALAYRGVDVAGPYIVMLPAPPMVRSGSMRLWRSDGGILAVDTVLSEMCRGR